MRNTGQIIIIDDDSDDLELITGILESFGTPNEIVTFSDSTQVVEYLKNPEIYPFLIISDINMPKLNGYELRDQIAKDTHLNLKCVPFVYFTTAQSREAVIEAYCKSVQGFFIKGNDYNTMHNRLKLIIEYWRDAIAPSDAMYN
jgi:CheY-like chemotaxis protein